MWVKTDIYISLSINKINDMQNTYTNINNSYHVLASEPLHKLLLHARSSSLSHTFSLMTPIRSSELGIAVTSFRKPSLILYHLYQGELIDYPLSCIIFVASCANFLSLKANQTVCPLPLTVIHSPFLHSASRIPGH